MADEVFQMPDFSAYCYLMRYPDILKSQWAKTPELTKQHYDQYGKNEGRIPGCDAPPAGKVYSAVFDPLIYLDRYPDVAKGWRGTPLDHWLNHGKAEGRIPGRLIDDPALAVVVKDAGSGSGSGSGGTGSTGDTGKPADNFTPAAGSTATTAAAASKKNNLLLIGLCVAAFAGIVVVIVKRKQIFG